MRRAAFVLVTLAAVVATFALPAPVLTASVAAPAPVHLFWANYIGGSIGRANLNGTGVDEAFVGAGDGPCGVAVYGGHIYWGEEHGEAIGRANLNGTGVDLNFISAGVSAVAAAAGGGPCGVAVYGGNIYWTDCCGSGDSIGRANLSGTGVEPKFITGLYEPAGGGPEGVAVGAGHIYWANWSFSVPMTTIGRANLDGTHVDQKFVTGANNPGMVSIGAGHLDWTNSGPWTSGQIVHTTIGRANLDGTDVDENFITGTDDSVGLVIYGGYVYWANYGNDVGTTIGRAKLPSERELRWGCSLSLTDHVFGRADRRTANHCLRRLRLPPYETWAHRCRTLASAPRAASRSAGPPLAFRGEAS